MRNFAVAMILLVIFLALPVNAVHNDSYFCNTDCGTDSDTIGLYHADTGTGTVLIDSSDKYNGTLNSVGWSSGKFNSAINLTGSTSSFVSFDSGTQWTSGNNFTFEAWVFPTDLSGTHHIYHVEDAANNFIIVRFENDELRFQISDNENGTGGNIITSTVNFITYNWVHIAVVFNTTDNSMWIYKNGIVAATGTSTGKIPVFNDDLIIGKNEVTDDRVYKGLIDEVRISNVTRLSPGLIDPDWYLSNLTIFFMEEETLNPLGNVSLTIESDDYGEFNRSTQFMNVTINLTDYFNVDDIRNKTTDEFKVTVQYSGGVRYYYPYVYAYNSSGSTIFLNLNTWFPTTGAVYTWTAQPGGVPLQGLKITVQRYLNGTWQNVTQVKTAIDGSATTLVRQYITHHVILEHINCTKEEFDYTFSTITTIPLNPLCTGSGGNITPEISEFDIKWTWTPNQTYTKTGVTVLINDTTSTSSAVWLNVTRFNLTNSTEVYFLNVSSSVYLFNYSNLVNLSIYRFTACAYTGNETFCQIRNYINSSFIGIGNLTAPELSEITGISMFMLQFLFFIGLSIACAIGFKMFGVYSLIIIPVGMIWAVGAGLFGWVFGLVISLVAAGMLMMGR